MDWAQLRARTVGSLNMTVPVAFVIVTFSVLSIVPQSQLAWVKVRVLFPITIRDVMFRAMVRYVPAFLEVSLVGKRASRLLLTLIVTSYAPS